MNFTKDTLGIWVSARYNATKLAKKTFAKANPKIQVIVDNMLDEISDKYDGMVGGIVEPILEKGKSESIFLLDNATKYASESVAKDKSRVIELEAEISRLSAIKKKLISDIVVSEKKAYDTYKTENMDIVERQYILLKETLHDCVSEYIPKMEEEMRVEIEKIKIRYGGR